MENLLRDKLAELKALGITHEICEQVGSFVQQSAPPALVKISPYVLAEKWHASRGQMLDAFLFATRLGVFDLEWDLRCPSCWGSTQLSDALAKLHSHSSCNYCGIEFDGGFDDGVEVTFRVNPNIRDLGDLQWLDVVKTRFMPQQGITMSAEANHAQELRLDIEPGTYHLFDDAMMIAAPMRVDGDPTDELTEVEFVYDGEHLLRSTEPLRPGPFSIRLANRSDRDLELVFARAREIPYVSGAEVACHQNFRDLFSMELIAPNEDFSIKSMAFVFTDIKGSTELYERLGDSRAYALVRDHFDIIMHEVKDRHGAVVKTIGDAVMATFMHDGDALQAALAAHRAFEEFNRQEISRDDIIIKAGIHSGPCLAVSSNDKLDYFGRTVNMAARIQGLSNGRDIMMSKTYADEAGISDVIGSSHWTTRPFQASLKGIESLCDVVQLTPPVN